MSIFDGSALIIIGNMRHPICIYGKGSILYCGIIRVNEFKAPETLDVLCYLQSPPGRITYVDIGMWIYLYGIKLPYNICSVNDFDFPFTSNLFRKPKVRFIWSFINRITYVRIPLFIKGKGGKIAHKSIVIG